MFQVSLLASLDVPGLSAPPPMFSVSLLTSSNVPGLSPPLMFSVSHPASPDVTGFPALFVSMSHVSIRFLFQFHSFDLTSCALIVSIALGFSGLYLLLSHLLFISIFRFHFTPPQQPFQFLQLVSPKTWGIITPFLSISQSLMLALLLARCYSLTHSLTHSLSPLSLFLSLSLPLPLSLSLSLSLAIFMLAFSLFLSLCLSIIIVTLFYLELILLES